MRVLSMSLVLAGLGACSRGPEQPLNILLVTLDTTRADALGCYGGPPGLTPHLDRLALESVVYTQARTVAPLTLPAHASMLTGLYPPRHTVRDNGLMPVPQAAQTLAESLAQRGLQTAAVVASTALDRAFGLDQGFASYQQPQRPLQQTNAHFVELRAAEVTARASQWLARRDPARPFFLWAHYFDPHVPYAPPSSFLDRARGNPYLGEVATMDDAVGNLLAPLRADGTLERTLVIVVGDHGESQGEHGEPTHGAFCYDATLRVPFMLRYPRGWGAGRRSDEIVSVADVFPTVQGALGLEPDKSVDGIDLYGAQVPRERGVYFESYSGWLNYGWSQLAGWVDRDGKYLASSEPELYLPYRDAGELDDRIEHPPVPLERYRKAIDALMRRPALAAEHGERFDSGLLADLRALGYGATGAPPPAMPHPLEASDLPSPRSRADELEPLLYANALAEQGQHEPAVELLRAILARNPRNWLAQDFLGFDLMQLGRFEEAREVFRARLASGPQRADTRINLGTCQERLGELEDALEHFRAAATIDPHNAQALQALAELLERSGRADEAREARARLEGVRGG